MATKHTPGPWEWRQYRTMRQLGSPNGALSATMPLPNNKNYSKESRECADANAALIAAAPDLLDACRDAVHALSLSDVCQDEINEIAGQIQAAIAKAEGK